MRSKTVQRLMDEMEKDPWHVKLKRWWRLKVWVYTCLTRKYWDKTFDGYIFKKKQSGGEIGKRSVWVATIGSTRSNRQTSCVGSSPVLTTTVGEALSLKQKDYTDPVRKDGIVGVSPTRSKTRK